MAATRKARRRRANPGKRIGKDGERAAGALLHHLGCYTAMTEIQGLAGDDKFVRDPDNKWWSVEVKHTKDGLSDHMAQAKEQARKRYVRIQEELTGFNGDVYRALKLDSYSEKNWLLMWRPRCRNLHADEWIAFYRGEDGYTEMMVMNKESAPWTTFKRGE